jgi:transposase
MVEIEFSTEAIESLREGRFQERHPKVQLKLEVLYLKSQALRHNEIISLCRISKTTFYRYLKEYQVGGIERLKQVKPPRRPSALWDYRVTLEAYFRAHPVATIAEAAVRIEELTGRRRKPTQVRTFLQAIGMKLRRVGQIPAKADIEQQEAFQTAALEPRLEEAKAGKRAVLFLDAAHFVFAPFLGLLWCFERLFVKAPSGRTRLNVLAGLDAVSREIFTVQNLTYITSATVCELLAQIAAAYRGLPITVVLDNARYQRCALVQSFADRLKIEWLYLPTSSPNLNLIERFWKFVKKKCLYSKYYADKEAFVQAIHCCIEESQGKYKKELESLLTLKFQTFKEVKVVGKETNILLFPVKKAAQQAQGKVSSKAA